MLLPQYTADREKAKWYEVPAVIPASPISYNHVTIPWHKGAALDYLDISWVVVYIEEW
jgi:hypothetical protein